MKLQAVLLCQLRDESFIRVGFRPPQTVVEVNDRKHNSDFLAQLQEQSQQRYRIGSSRNRNSRPITGLEKPQPADVLKHALNQFAHAQCYIDEEQVAPEP
jgi:hypothetical protein